MKFSIVNIIVIIAVVASLATVDAVPVLDRRKSKKLFTKESQIEKDSWHEKRCKE
jgi:hypothetical protein